MTAELGTLDLIWVDDSSHPIKLRTRLINGAEGCWVNFTCEQAVDIATQLLLSVRETKATREGAQLLTYTGPVPLAGEFQPFGGTDRPRRSRRRRPRAISLVPPEAESQQ